MRTIEITRIDRMLRIKMQEMRAIVIIIGRWVICLVEETTQWIIIKAIRVIIQVWVGIYLLRIGINRIKTNLKEIILTAYLIAIPITIIVKTRVITIIRITIKTTTKVVIYSAQTIITIIAIVATTTIITIITIGECLVQLTQIQTLH